MKQREKFEVIPAEGLSAKSTIPLTSLRGIRKEAGRVYRAVANGRLPSEEGTRKFFMLDKARVMLMAEQEAAVIDGTATARGTVVGTINIGGIPSGWAVAALYGQEAHMPFETLRRLKELLPADAFEPIPDPFLPAAIDDDMPAARPFLRLHEGAEPVDPEPPPAA